MAADILLAICTCPQQGMLNTGASAAEMTLLSNGLQTCNVGLVTYGR